MDLASLFTLGLPLGPLVKPRALSCRFLSLSQPFLLVLHHAFRPGNFLQPAVQNNFLKKAAGSSRPAPASPMYT